MPELSHGFFGQREKMIAAAAALAFAFFYFDPVGLDSQKAQSVDRWLAWFGQYRYASKASDKLAVILIDERSLDRWQTDWPISYRQIGGMIHELACAHAAAVFFDFTLARKYNLADGSDELKAAMEDSSAIGPACPDGQRPALLPVFFGKAKGISSPLSREADAADRTFWIETSTHERTYPAGRVEFPDHMVTNSEVTPAFGILRRLCTDKPAGGAALASVCVDGVSVANSSNPLLLTWSGRIDPDQSRVSDTSGCRPEPRWWEMPVIAVGASDIDFYQRCPPFLTLTARDLYRDYEYITRHRDPAALLRGRIILVGTDLTGLNDVVVSPVHDRLPGVYQHAVALDNLITFGSRYDTMPRPTEKYLSVAVCYLLVESAQYIIARGEQPGGGRRKWLVDLLMYIAIILIFIGFGYFALWQDWPISLVFVALSYYFGPVLVGLWSRYFSRGRAVVGVTSEEQT